MVEKVAEKTATNDEGRQSRHPGNHVAGEDSDFKISKEFYQVGGEEKDDIGAHEAALGSVGLKHVDGHHHPPGMRHRAGQTREIAEEDGAAPSSRWNMMWCAGSLKRHSARSDGFI